MSRSLLSLIRQLGRCQRGAGAVEFAFILPLLLLLSFAAIEFIAVFSEYHKANEATRIIARNLSKATPLVSQSTLLSNSPHVCTPETCPGLSGIIADAQKILPALTTADVNVTYEVKDVANIGYSVGYKPMITVRLDGVQYNFTLISMFPGVPQGFALNPAETSTLGKWY
ncbi:TadE/TadG family type IV pilus assembly protein [Sneathiella chinensis]|uniref:TadE-like domain-containing protein n=1 Tax=Sneathiella chinensis TaxID=349750 RepID=A0ABQ5U857_9PROT|nr:TadE/TadG family type IV pilus assembly protein [Sneathiella chinensis]GLQ07383.1 hypothetical protein GCM10007924_26040 [Sneathiella chinensis]